MINRDIKPLVEDRMYKGKIIIIYGARQVGKTTLAKEILKESKEGSVYLNCDEPDIREALENKTSTEIKSFLGDNKLVVIDEAQRIKNIGLTLKLVVDNFPDIQIIATGSSSFDLANEISEPLTGRKYEFHLYSFSLKELKQIYSDIEIDRLIETRMIFGMYPEVVLNSSEAKERVENIARSYLYKDILAFQKIKYPDVLDKLLQALALQIGNEVSYNELAEIVGVDKNTIAGYIQILEKAFVIFRLNPYSKNIRNELKKMRKIYFYDTGVRNAIIRNFNPLNLRQDTGALWENFLISERMKLLSNSRKDIRSYFWRTTDGKEIDYIEEDEQRLSAFEMKWRKSKFRKNKTFLGAYEGSSITLINKDNYSDFVLE